MKMTLLTLASFSFNGTQIVSLEVHRSNQKPKVTNIDRKHRFFKHRQIIHQNETLDHSYLNVLI